MKRDLITNEQLCALAKRGDADAQNLLIENNLRFIKKAAYEVWSAQAELNRSLQISLDDLVQEGSLGLLGCIDSYNSNSGNLFLTYAGSAIRNAMIDYVRSQNVPFEAKNLNSIVPLDELAKMRFGASTVLLQTPLSKLRNRYIWHRNGTMISTMLLI